MKLWIDSHYSAPESYYLCRSVNTAQRAIRALDFFYQHTHNEKYRIELIDIGYNIEINFKQSRNYIKLLKWLEEEGLNYPIRIHTVNLIGVYRIRRIIKRNGWTEVV